jgi:phosphohistidine phosphatase SixA
VISRPLIAKSRLAGSLVLFLAAMAAHAQQLQGRELVDALRAGGFNIYFRHAQTNWSQGDDIDNREQAESCDGGRVRQLSDEGRQASERVGRSIAELGVPVGRVLASPYCRTMETARLMDVGAVQATDDLMNLRSAHYVGGREAVIRRARALIGSAPSAGTNNILVAHGNVARNATPVYPGEAEGVVFRPDGEGGFELVARITPDDWADLARRFAD